MFDHSSQSLIQKFHIIEANRRTFWLGLALDQNVMGLKYVALDGMCFMIRRLGVHTKQLQMTGREVNNRLTGWAFAHLVNYFAHPVN